MKDCKSVGAPMSPEDLKEAASVIDENGEIDEGEYTDAASASTYRSIAARMNYLAMGRADLQLAFRCICAYMSKHLKMRCQLLKRMARHLKESQMRPTLSLRRNGDWIPHMRWQRLGSLQSNQEVDERWSHYYWRLCPASLVECSVYYGAQFWRG